MAKLQRLAGSTSNILEVFVQDTSQTDGRGLTGLLYTTSGLACYYKRSSGTVAVEVTLADISTLGTFASGGFKEVDATNLPGIYEFHPPNSALDTGAKSVVVMLRGAANMAPVLLEIELTAVDNQDATRGGMAALPNAAAAASNGLPTVGTSSGQVNLSGGRVLSDVVYVGGQAISTPNVSGVLPVDIIKVSGQDASLTTNLALGAAGVDSVVIETGINLRQAISVLLAYVAGVKTGVTTTTPTVKNPAGTVTRAQPTVDLDGNCSANTLSLPT